jgi:hypothetical protein
MEYGENLAILALGFLAGDPERLGRFLSLAGIEPEMIRAAASIRRFLPACWITSPPTSRCCSRLPNILG